MQHGHKVALARSERSAQEGAPAHAGRDRLRDQAQRDVEGLGQRGVTTYSSMVRATAVSSILSVSRNT